MELTDTECIRTAIWDHTPLPDTRHKWILTHSLTLLQVTGCGS